MAQRVTIYDVAQRVGMSVSTVSRVLNNSSLISTEKADLIRATAAEMGYVKRTIRRQAKRTILTVKLFLPMLDESALHLFYDLPSLVDSIKAGFGETRVNVVTIAARDRHDSFDNKRLGQIDACIFAFCRPDDRLRRTLEELHVPFVLLNRRDGAAAFVTPANEEGLARLVDEMAREAARRRVALVPAYLAFDPVREISDEREAGFRRGCTRNGLATDAAFVIRLASLSAVDDALFRDLARRGVNAVLTFEDVVAVSFYQAALHRGVAIPDDLMLAGFDNSPVLALLDRRIDTIDLETGRLGFAAGEWLRRVVIDRDDSRLAELVHGRYVAGDTIRRARSTGADTTPQM